jgi:gamma-glutamylcyclotransferase (GGCT)/AIG2-like uncharacterized protein YtfP
MTTTYRGSKSFVFVYGSLKRGHHNHAQMADARFVAAAKTVACYRLFDLGSYPAMIERPSQRFPDAGVAIEGEIYEVDATTLAHLDWFEGHPNFYRRERIAIEGFDHPTWGYLFMGDLSNATDCGTSWEGKR